VPYKAAALYDDQIDVVVALLVKREAHAKAGRVKDG
jgi:hypothetical protein